MHAVAALAGEFQQQVAGVVDDIQLDILPSFPGRRLDLELATPHDDSTFAERVRRAFAARRPEERHSSTCSSRGTVSACGSLSRARPGRA